MSTYGDALRSLAQSVDGLAQERDFVVTQNAVKDSEIAALQSALYECQHPARGLLGWNKQDARFGARRLYFASRNIARMLADIEAVADAGQRPLVSLKSGLSLAELPALPPCDFAWHHEPEDDFADPMVFRAGFDEASVFLPVGVRPVVCLTGWTFDPRSGRNPADWLPATAQALAVDIYNWAYSVTKPQDPWRSPGEMMAPVLGFAAAHGLPLLVWETNSYEDPFAQMRKAEWLQEWASLAEAERIEQVCFFDSTAGQPNAFRLLSSDPAATAVQELLDARYFGG